MALVSIAQVLSGYDQGHGVLAIGGDVQDAERALVDRLSDLSGYLPLDVTFTSYWTGYPCGRHYAFACTWPDTTAVRSGTVLTQTLLVPKNAVGDMDDIGVLASTFTRPASAADRAPYRTPIEIDPRASARGHESASEERARAVAALWFGQSDRPLFWVDQEDTTAVVKALWRLLSPEARQDLAFCTFALGVRKIDRRPFDFLALPPEARASFLEWMRSPAWFDQGKLKDPGVRHFAAERWTGELLEQGAALFEPLFALCREHALPRPPAWKLREGLRFWRLEQSAADTLNAARTRVDLLFWLWPDLAAGHPLARSVLGALLLALPAAPIDRRPLRELNELVGRKVVSALADQDPAFDRDVTRTLADETARRLRENPAAETELLGFLHACERASWRTAVLRAAASLARGSLAPALLAASARMEEPSWIRDTLEPLPTEQRAAMVASASAELDATQARWLWMGTGQAAFALKDLALVLAAGDSLGDRGESLDRAMTLAHDSGMDFTSLSSRIQPEALLAWALSATKEAAWTERLGEEAARALHLDLETLATQCQAAQEATGEGTNAAARIFARIAAMSWKEPIEKALRSRAPLAARLVRLAIREGRPAALLLKEALSALPEEDLLTEAILVELERSEHSAWARDAVEWLVPRLVQALRRGTILPGQAARWLALPDTRQFVQTASQSELFHRYPGWRPGEGLTVLAEAARQSLEMRAEKSSAWIASLIRPVLANASPEQLADASEAMAGLLAAPLDSETSFKLAAASLDAVRRESARGGHAIVERAFPIVYPVLASERHGHAPWYVLLWKDNDGWDRAKTMRRWLLGTWLEWGWPPAGFLRALGGDHALFERMVSRMSRTKEGLKLLRSLGDVVTADPELTAVWGGDVRRALANPNAPVDYE